MRASCLKFLEEQLGIVEDCLSFNAVLEDDYLSTAFLEARAAGINPATVLRMVLKAEGDATLAQKSQQLPKIGLYKGAKIGLGFVNTDWHL